MGNLTPNIDRNLFKIDPEYLSSYRRIGNIKPASFVQMEKEFNALELIDLNNSTHKESLLELFPLYLIEECDDADWKLFESMSRYDRKKKTFVAGCFDNQILEFKLISSKWRYIDGIKWKTRAGTSPNGTLFIRIFTDDGTIYVVEGHRDSLTAVLLGLDFIMIPYAGFRLKDIGGLKLELLDRRVVFIAEDEAAFKCMYNIAKAIEVATESTVLLSLENGKKMDLSNYALTKNSIKEVRDGLKDSEFNRV